MARSLNPYQRQVVSQQVTNQPKAQFQGDGSEMVGQALSGVGREVGNYLDNQLQEDKKRIENDAAIMASNELSNAEVQWQDYQRDKFQSWKVGDPTLSDTINTDFEKYRSEVLQKLPTDASKLFVQQHLNKMKTGLLNKAADHEQKAFTSKMNADTELGIAADSNIVFGDRSRLADVVTRRVETIQARNDLDEAQKAKAVESYTQSMFLSAERGQLEQNPEEWFKQRFGGVQNKSTGQVKTVVPSMDIAQAIFFQESGGGKADTSKFNSQGVTGPMQIQQGTFDGMKRMGLIPRDYDITNPEQNKDAGFKWVDYLSNKYDGDQSKVAAAYYGGEGAVNKDGSINRHWRNKQRPQDPTVGEYVDQVNARIGVAPKQLEEVEQKPEEVIQPNTFSSLPWEKQLELKRFAETKIKQGQAVYRANADRTVKAAEAMHQDGIVDPFGLTPEFFSKAYGPVDGPMQYAQYQESRDMGSDIAAFKGQSAAEINAEIAASAPALTSDYVEADMRYNTRRKAADAVLEQRKKDPALYVLTNNPALARQQAELLSLPAPVSQQDQDQRTLMYTQFATNSLAEQNRLGIGQPAILPAAMAENIVSAFNASIGNGDNMATRIAQASKDWGDQWPTVYRQLAKGFKDQLPESFLTIPGVESPAARETIARLDQVKIVDLEKQTDPANAKKIKETVMAELEPFAKSLPSNKTNSDTYQAVSTAVTKMALERVIAGQDLEKSVSNAAKVFTGQYEFIEEFSQNTYAVPKAENPELVTSGLALKMEQLDSLGIAPPPGRYSSEARNPEEVQAAWLERVKEASIWATNDDENGLKLYAEGQDGFTYPVFSTDGKQIEFKFSELRGAVEERRQQRIRERSPIPTPSMPGAGRQVDLRGTFGFGG